MKDELIDAITLRYQQVWFEKPGLDRDAVSTEMLANAESTPLKGMTPASLVGRMSKIGLTKTHQDTKLKSSSSAWSRLGLNGDAFKAAHKTWVNSIEFSEGHYRPGDTDAVNEALVKTLKERGYVLGAATVFDLRCSIGWGTTKEIRSADYIPGTRKEGVLERATETAVPSLFDEVDPVSTRLEQHGAEIKAIHDALAELRDRLDVIEAPRPLSMLR